MTSSARLLARYDSIDAQADGLAGTPRALPAAPSAATPTRVHEQTIALVDELLAQIDTAGALAPVLRGLRAMCSRMLRDFAQVPEAEIVAFLHDLGARMLAVGAE